MSANKNEYTWHQHPGTFKWHAFASGELESVCGYTKLATPGLTEAPAAEALCMFCRSALGLKSTSRPKRPPERQKVEEVSESEEMEAEFIGGPFDGMRLPLTVVRESLTRLRVLGSSYEKKFKLPILERPARQPWES